METSPENHGISLSHTVTAVCGACAQVGMFSGCPGGSLMWNLLHCLRIEKDIFHGHLCEAT